MTLSSPRKGIQGSLEFWIPRRKLRIPSTGFLLSVEDFGFQSLVGFGSLDLYILDFKAQDSGFHK